MTKVRAEIDAEMRRWDAIGYVVSCVPAYRRGSTDPGVALWWSMRRRSGADLRVLPCDQYRLAEANAHAIALTLDALRGCDRWGAYSREQAVEGARLALPGARNTPPRPWHEVLGVNETTPLIVCDAAYRALAKERQADNAQMIELNLAIEAARRERS